MADALTPASSAKPGFGQPTQAKEPDAHDGTQSADRTDPCPAPVGEATPSTPAPRKKRKDNGRLHASRHGLLSRHLLGALASLGEDPKYYRRLERKLRKTLQPHGQLGAVLFDRWWSSYLRLVLAARLEARTMAAADTRQQCKPARPVLVEGEVPTLLVPVSKDGAEQGEDEAATLSPDVLRQLVLVQRYDRHFGREMMRALALLILLREEGEKGLQK